jgi:chromosomal replication initiator protein
MIRIVDYLKTGVNLPVFAPGSFPESVKPAQTVIDIVCQNFNMLEGEVLSKGKLRQMVMPRQIIHWFLKKYTKMSLAEIGYAAGMKDHATVLHSIRTVQNLCDTNKKYRQKIVSIDLQIHAL